MNRVRPKLIAITGGSGSGKSWLAERLQTLLGPALRVSLDAFYRDRSHLSMGRRAIINYDHPRCIDWPLAVHVLRQLKLGRPTQAPAYDFSTHSRRAAFDILSPAPLLLVEGLWLLRRLEMRRLFDLAIFLDCPQQQRLNWRMARDVSERARTETSVREQFCSTVAPMHDRYVQPQRRYADLVLKQPLDAQEVGRLFDRVWEVTAAGELYPASKLARLRQRAVGLLAREDV